MEASKKTVFSGIQPSGQLTIGNYLGALRNFTKLQEQYNCLYCVVDLHAITVPQDAAKLRANTYELVALYLACGIQPDKSAIFVQSHVSAHAELAWVLNTISYVGELNRMTQFKDKSSKLNNDSINMGLMDYPVLMASDILLYNTDLVPVGVDQKQHLELARDLAVRFNNRYSPTFVVPDPFITKSGAKIMSLADASVKMSKSDSNDNGYILMLDDAATIMRKVKRATTDSDTTVKYSEDKKEISNLLTIYSLFSGLTIEQIEEKYVGVGYGTFKEELGQVIIDGLTPIQVEQQRILKDKAYINSVLKQGATTAENIARKTLSKVYRKVGFVPREY